MHNLGVKLYFGEGMESDRPCMEAFIFPGFASLVSSLNKAMVVTNKIWCVYIDHDSLCICYFFQNIYVIPKVTPPTNIYGDCNGD